MACEIGDRPSPPVRHAHVLAADSLTEMTWSAEVDGRVLTSGTRRAGLAKGAVLTIFEEVPKYLSKRVKSPRKPVQRQSRAVAPRYTVSKSRSFCESESVRSGGADGAPTTDRAATCVVAGCGCEAENTVAHSSKTPFEILFNFAPSMCLPGPSWKAHRIDNEGIKDVLFNDAYIQHSSASSAMFTKKTLHVKRDMFVQAYVLKVTVEFTLFLNNIFDALNRRFSRESLTLGCNDFFVIESASKWLDEWEQEVVNLGIPKDFFRAPSTAEGLRATLKSVPELPRYLFTE
ncbi:hypothetical protein HPB51_028463 [Rhipicephalus microplus]|uniref:Uncharacterized protein n=1 Tax=Rhipicephalus microplus TaxID=6941 RepID=A0A9J6CXQ0_RHIMP|nr:hypothetical protein HPB51_028463 [Rhipicephalus microplus]